MINFKYADHTNTVVLVGNESWLVTAPHVQQWLAEGNTPLPADPVVIPVPASLTMKQARLALLAAGYLDSVEAGVSAMSRASQIAWEFAATVERSDPLTATLAEALSLDDAELDELFTLAATF